MEKNSCSCEDKRNKVKQCELDLAKLKMCTKYLYGTQSTVITFLRTALIMPDMRTVS